MNPQSGSALDIEKRIEFGLGSVGVRIQSFVSKANGRVKGKFCATLSTLTTWHWRRKVTT